MLHGFLIHLWRAGLSQKWLEVFFCLLELDLGLLRGPYHAKLEDGKSTVSIQLHQILIEAGLFGS
jgi:hypothetical protein